MKVNENKTNVAYTNTVIKVAEWNITDGRSICMEYPINKRRRYV
jgi:hypothetical protein